MTRALELYRVYQDEIAECDREIEAQLERFENHNNGEPTTAQSGQKRITRSASKETLLASMFGRTYTG